MYRLACLALVVAAGFTLIPNEAQAGTIYNVDLQSGPLQVYGTVTYDGTNAITNFALQLQHLSDTPIALTQLLVGALEGTEWQYTVSGSGLYFQQIASTAAVSLRFLSPSGVYGLTYGTNTNTGVPFGQLGDSTTGDFDFLPVTSSGILIGTATVPEPTAYVMAVIAIALLGGYSGLRKRFTKCPV